MNEERIRWLLGLDEDEASQMNAILSIRNCRIEAAKDYKSLNSRRESNERLILHCNQFLLGSTSTAIEFILSKARKRLEEVEKQEKLLELEGRFAMAIFRRDVASAQYIVGLIEKIVDDHPAMRMMLEVECNSGVVK